MGDPPTGTSAECWERHPDETSWDWIARLRQLREQLNREITKGTPTAVAEAKAAEVNVAQLAELWDVTAAWIYTVAPARPKDGQRRKTSSNDQ